jgi:hypothetical protein
MKHRIQHPEFRIQPRHGTSGCACTRKLEKGEGAVVAAGRRAEATGTLLRSEATEGGAGAMKKRAEVGKGDLEIGKSWNIYRLATGFSHFETALTRLFPPNSTQVVDFPRIALAGLFREVKDSPQRRRDAEASVDGNQYWKMQNEPRRHRGTGTRGDKNQYQETELI